MRVPPSLTNSATTSSSRRLTSSMKAGGKDHSRPTSRPIFKVIRVLPSRSIVTTDVHSDHLLPPWPIVNPAIPDAQSMPDVLVPEDTRKVLIVRARGIVTANGENNVHVPHCIQPRRILLVLDEVARVIEIDIVIRVAICKTFDVVAAAQADNAVDQLRVTESKIDGVISAEAGAGRDQVRIRVKLDGERQDFVQEVVIILRLPPGPFCGGTPFCVPAFGVNTINTK